MMLEIDIESDEEWDSSTDWSLLVRRAAESALAESAFPQLANGPRPVRGGGGLEERVDGRPRTGDRRIDRHRDVTGLDQQVIIGRCQVHVPWLYRCAMARLTDGQASFPSEQLAQERALVGPTVLNDGQAALEIGG